MSKRCLAVLVAGLAACSDGGQPLDGPQPQVEPQVEPPLIGTLTTYSMTDTHLAPLPVTPTFVAYRGEGGDWERVEAVGPTTAFTIEHPRYMLWVACPFTDAGRDSVHALLLTDQDSLEPAVRCPLPERRRRPRVHLRGGRPRHLRAQRVDRRGEHGPVPSGRRRGELHLRRARPWPV